MLILVRKPGECLKIGDDITFKIVESSGKQVKIGIDAPRDVIIIRSELEKK